MSVTRIPPAFCWFFNAVSVPRRAGGRRMTARLLLYRDRSGRLGAKVEGDSYSDAIDVWGINERLTPGEFLARLEDACHRENVRAARTKRRISKRDGSSAPHAVKAVA